MKDGEVRNGSPASPPFHSMESEPKRNRAVVRLHQNRACIKIAETEANQIPWSACIAPIPFHGI